MKVVQARAVLQQMVDAGHGPGLFGLVTQDGRVLFSGGAGVADLGGRRKIREHDRFRVGGVTKTYIAALACLAEEQGCLRLADTAGRWLPEFGLDQELRVEDLLHLRSGLPDYVGALLGEPPRLDAYRRYHRPEDLIRLALSLDGRLTPGRPDLAAEGILSTSSHGGSATPAAL